MRNLEQVGYGRNEIVLIGLPSWSCSHLPPQFGEQNVCNGEVVIYVFSHKREELHFSSTDNFCGFGCLYTNINKLSKSHFNKIKHVNFKPVLCWTNQLQHDIPYFN